MTSNGRVARLTALALATGTLVAAGASSAGATTTTKGAPLQFGQAVGSVLRVEINLPATLAGLAPQHIVQDIALTDGTIDTLTSNIKGNALAALGSKESNVPVLSALLADDKFASKADLKNPSPANGGLLNIDQAGFKLQVLPAVSKVLNPATTLKGVVSESHSAVANIDIAPAGLADVLGTITAALAPVLNTAVGTINNTTAPVAATVTNTLGTLGAATKTAGLPVDVAGVLNTVSATLSNTLATVQTLPTTLSSATSLVHIAKLNSDRSITRNGDTVTAISQNALSNIDLLGGLVTVQALTSKAVATANGTSSIAAPSKPDAQIVHVTVKGVADLFIDKAGIHLADTLGSLVPTDVTGAVNGALGQLQGVLTTLGLEVQNGVGTATRSADGRTAESHASGAAISLNPLKALGIDKAAAPLVRLSMVNSNALVAATPTTLAAKRTVAPPTTVASLPRTGANLPLTGAIATGLVGLALVARRRRMTHGA